MSDEITIPLENITMSSFLVSTRYLRMINQEYVNVKSLVSFVIFLQIANLYFGKMLISRCPLDIISFSQFSGVSNHVHFLLLNPLGGLIPMLINLIRIFNLPSPRLINQNQSNVDINKVHQYHQLSKLEVTNHVILDILIYPSVMSMSRIP